MQDIRLLNDGVYNDISWCAGKVSLCHDLHFVVQTYMVYPDYKGQTRNG